MSNQVRAVFLVVVVAPVMVMAPVLADDSVDAEAHTTGINIAAQTSSGSSVESSAEGSASSAGGPAGTWHSAPTCEAGGLATCHEVVLCPDGSVMQTVWFEYVDGTTGPPYSSCPSEADAVVAEPVVITAGMAAQALRRVELPASVLEVQPPGGRTLVNFATNFFTSADAFDRSVRLLGQQVDLRIRPVSFGWRFGDGSVRRTQEAGSPYPGLDVTHSYVRRGVVAAAVDTTYGADFRVNGGPWAPVAGTVTMSGAPVVLQVETATPTLVGYR